MLSDVCSAVIEKDDEEGKVGVKIGKELGEAAGMALKANMTALGPLVLPLSEKLIFAVNTLGRKVQIGPLEPNMQGHSLSPRLHFLPETIFEPKVACMPEHRAEPSPS